MTTPLDRPVVSPRWLADHLDDDDVLVVDASVTMSPTGYASGRDAYLSQRLPGAVFADVLGALSDPGAELPLTRPSAERFATAAGALGIGEGTTVVLYDSTTGSWAARVWWLLRWLGHDGAAVLDGGIAAWTAQGLPLEAGDVVPQPETFVAHERPGVWVDQGDVLAVVAGEQRGLLLNAISRPPRDLPPQVAAAFTTQVPGSLRVPYPDLLEPGTGVLLPPDQLKAALTSIPQEGRTIAYCGSGIGASTAALALVTLGHTDVAVYDGSLAEWLADPDAPVERIAEGASPSPVDSS